MSARLGTLGDVDTDVGLTAGLGRAELRAHRLARRDHYAGVAMTGDPSTDLGVPSLADDLASSEQLAELRGEELVWQMLLHQASAELGNLAGYPHSRLARAALDVAAEHMRSAEKLLQSLDDVLGPKQSEHGRGLSARRLRQRVEREQQVMKQSS